MKIAIIGCGVMGSAFARHFAKKHSVITCDRDLVKAKKLAGQIGGKAQADMSLAVKEADLILLSVKPKDLTEIAKVIASVLSKQKIIFSILAGTPISILKKRFPKATVVRSMPNLALTCGQGVIGVVQDPKHSLKVRKSIDPLLKDLGFVAWMPEEKLEALTAISGSGIGFVLVMIEAMIDGGVHLGFTAQDSREFVLKTIEGAVALMRESGKHPAELKLNISSPGGTTIAGLKVMEEQGVRSGIIHTLIASYEKALNMMKNLSE